MKSIKVCEYSRSRSFHYDLILKDQASGERSQDQWSSGLKINSVEKNLIFFMILLKTGCGYLFEPPWHAFLQYMFIAVICKIKITFSCFCVFTKCYALMAYGWFAL